MKTAHAHPQSHTQSNTALVKEGFEYFAKKDIPSLVSLLSDDVKWLNPGPKDILPWVGNYNGKKGVSEFFKLLDENMEFPVFEPREYIEQGNKVIALGYYEYRSKQTGRRGNGDFAMVFTINSHNKISQHQAYGDTYAMVETHR